MLFIVALALGLVSIARAQQTITPEDAAKFIGQQKTVCGMVASANHPSLTYTEDLTEQPTFLNFNKPFPNQVFTVTILGGDRGKFEKPPETLYSGKEICVTGMIQSYQGRPEIIVKDPSQIKVK
jgi:micrococcal nuclease